MKTTPTQKEKNVIIAKSQGWTVSARGWWSHPTLPDNGGAMSSPPDYYWDVSYALTLCDALAKEGWRCYCNQGTDGTLECEFRFAPGEENTHYGPGDTLAAAICESYGLTKGLW